MLLKICSKCEILLKCRPKCEKVPTGGQNAIWCSNLKKSAEKVLSAIGKGLLTVLLACTQSMMNDAQKHHPDFSAV